MFNDIFREVTGVLDRRFLVNAFFPNLIFWGLLVIVVFAGAGWDLVKLAQIWNQQDITFKTLQIVGCLSWVTFFSWILTSQLNAIVRFYEGYWNFPLGRRLAAIGKKWHQEHLKELHSQLIENKASFYNSIYQRYPLPTQPQNVMPTTLGNILKNAELYSFDHYDLDAVLIWPRLYNLLPESFLKTFAEAKSSLDFMLVISALSGIFALLSGVYLLIIQASGWLFLLCFWGGCLVGWLAYQGALGSAVVYAELIKSSFDLYRNELLKQMRLPLPKTPQEEMKQWREIGEFIYFNNTAVAWEYNKSDID